MRAQDWEHPEGVGADEYLRKHYRHRLRRVWKDFTSIHLELSRFDATIDALDVWEELRYPGRGAVMFVGFGAATVLPPGPSGGRYSMDAHSLDECFHAVWNAASINPHVLRLAKEQDDLWARAYETNNRFYFPRKEEATGTRRRDKRGKASGTPGQQSA